MRHIPDETGQCPHWCSLCLKERRERAELSSPPQHRVFDPSRCPACGGAVTIRRRDGLQDWVCAQPACPCAKPEFITLVEAVATQLALGMTGGGPGPVYAKGADPLLVRTPDGHINNCSLAFNEPEAECQMCQGNCPDRGSFLGHPPRVQEF